MNTNTENTIGNADNLEVVEQVLIQTDADIGAEGLEEQKDNAVNPAEQVTVH